MRLIIYCLALLFLSCNQDTDKDFMDVKLYKVITDYQLKYPIPNDNPKNRIFVYKVYFWNEEKDTIVVLQRSAAGISKDDVGYGIYEDKDLLPTFIYDEHNLSSQFISKKLSNKSNNSFYWLKGAPPESSPPVFTYVVKNKELQLQKIDTVWSKWD